MHSRRNFCNLVVASPLAILPARAETPPEIAGRVMAGDGWPAVVPPHVRTIQVAGARQMIVIDDHLWCHRGDGQWSCISRQRNGWIEYRRPDKIEGQYE